jgi:hypothetical protein
MRLKLTIMIVLALVVSGGLLAFSPLPVVDAVRSGATAVGPAYPLFGRITCDTTAGGVAIAPTGSHNLVSYECISRGAISIGNVDGVGGALTFANGFVVANGDRFGANVRTPERCISAGSVVLECRFLVAE